MLPSLNKDFNYLVNNEQETGFLAAVDFENVNITDKVDTVTVAKSRQKHQRKHT